MCLNKVCELKQSRIVFISVYFKFQNSILTEDFIELLSERLNC